MEGPLRRPWTRAWITLHHPNLQASSPLEHTALRTGKCPKSPTRFREDPKNICGEHASRWLVEAFTSPGADADARPGATPRPMTARRLNRPLGGAVVHHCQCPRLARERRSQIDPQQPSCSGPRNGRFWRGSLFWTASSSGKSGSPRSDGQRGPLSVLKAAAGMTMRLPSPEVPPPQNKC
jgi:hypothetical protein